MRKYALAISALSLLGCSSRLGSANDAGSDSPSPQTDGAAMGDASTDAGATDGAVTGDASGDAGATPDAADGSMGSAGPRFIGRFDGAGQSSWSHSAVALRFTGTDVSVTLSGASVWYEVSLDGKLTKFQGGSGTYSLGSGLTNGPHDVMLVRREESFFGVSKFVSFSVPPNQWLPNVIPSRRMEIIGDSISAGFGDEGCPWDVNENSDLSYGAVAARAVGADVHIVAQSGIGMVKSYNSTTTMPQIYGRTFGENDNTPWDFTKYSPDVVVINLGTNDAAGGVDATQYQTAYASFLTTVRGNYPNALVYCVSQGGYTLASEVQAVVSAKSDPKIKYLALIGNNAGCNSHPDVAGQQQMASGLVAALQSDLGW
ncbi:MAG TPA: GDSL-type esterase/lipase family protein [Polyangiaceae bacterium]|nr:GDSL-type esterase/lipase family protein [Polyangiaceae bacterium]